MNAARAHVGADAVELARARFGLVFGDDVLERGPTVPTGRLVELARALKDELGYGYLAYITAFHVPAKPAAEAQSASAAETPPPAPEARFVVVYRVRDVARDLEFAFRCDVAVSESVPSLVSVWAGADWQEREAFDLVGPVFSGHLDLRRIMLPEDWEGHPLQRQYAIDTPHRPWR